MIEKPKSDFKLHCKRSPTASIRARSLELLSWRHARLSSQLVAEMDMHFEYFHGKERISERIMSRFTQDTLSRFVGREGLTTDDVRTIVAYRFSNISWPGLQRTKYRQNSFLEKNFPHATPEEALTGTDAPVSLDVTGMINRFREIQCERPSPPPSTVMAEGTVRQSPVKTFGESECRDRQAARTDKLADIMVTRMNENLFHSNHVQSIKPEPMKHIGLWIKSIWWRIIRKNQ